MATDFTYKFDWINASGNVSQYDICRGPRNISDLLI